MNIISIVGARPQFIKLAPVCRAFAREENAALKHIIVHTGQHYDYEMSRVFFDQMGIPEPDYNLEVGSGNHGAQTAQMLVKMEELIVKLKPAMLLIYGDTNSTVAGALAASKLHVPVAHIEAGLRSYNKKMPEEINRILSDHVSSLLFTPTRRALENVAAEGFANRFDNYGTVPGNLKNYHLNNPLVLLSGDVMYDAVLFNSKLAAEQSTVLTSLGIDAGEFDLMTIHRAENTNDRDQLQAVFDFISSNGLDQVIFPLHPRTRNLVQQHGLSFPANVRTVDPVGYFDMLILEKNARRIMTDSGGVQKEAFFMQTPCITLRPETEWVETVESGWNILMKDFSGSRDDAERRDPADFFGDGNSAEYHIRVLREYLRA